MKLKMIAILMSIAIPLLVNCAPNSDAGTPLPLVAFSEIASGDHAISSQPVNRKLELFTDQVAFNAALYLFIQPLVEHTVDFSSRRVVFLSLGGRPTGGYSIFVEKIEDHGEFIKASIVIRKPGNCLVTQAITSPYQFVEVESVKELLFEERIEVVNCN